MFYAVPAVGPALKGPLPGQAMEPLQHNGLIPAAYPSPPRAGQISPYSQGGPLPPLQQSQYYGGGSGGQLLPAP